MNQDIPSIKFCVVLRRLLARLLICVRPILRLNLLSLFPLTRAYVVLDDGIGQILKDLDRLVLVDFFQVYISKKSSRYSQVEILEWTTIPAIEAQGAVVFLAILVLLDAGEVQAHEWRDHFSHLLHFSHIDCEVAMTQ